MLVHRCLDERVNAEVADQFTGLVPEDEIERTGIAGRRLDVQARLVARRGLADEVRQRSASERGLVLPVVHLDDGQTVLLQGLEEAAGLGGPVVNEFHRVVLWQIFIKCPAQSDFLFKKKLV